MEHWEADLIRGVSDEAWVGIQQRLRLLEQREADTRSEVKNHADELGDIREWFAQMGIRAMSEQERRGLAGMLRWWIARQTGIQLTRARLVLWCTVGGAVFTALSFGAATLAIALHH